MRYRAAGVPTMVFAGEEYGTGSSRDWAAKGTLLLGIRAVVARSFERIHRANLIGMGVLPLEFTGSDSAQTLGLTGAETFDLEGIGDPPHPAANGDPGDPRRFRLMPPGALAPAHRHPDRGCLLPA